MKLSTVSFLALTLSFSSLFCKPEITEDEFENVHKPVYAKNVKGHQYCKLMAGGAGIVAGATDLTIPSKEQLVKAAAAVYITREVYLYSQKTYNFGLRKLEGYPIKGGLKDGSQIPHLILKGAPSHLGRVIELAGATGTGIVIGSCIIHSGLLD